MKKTSIVFGAAFAVLFSSSLSSAQTTTICDGVTVTHNTNCDPTNENIVVPNSDFWFGSFDDGFPFDPNGPSECRAINDFADLNFNMYYNYVSGLSDLTFLRFLNSSANGTTVKRNGIVSAANVLNHWFGSFTSTYIDASEYKFFVASNWDPKGMANYETHNWTSPPPNEPAANWYTKPASWTLTHDGWNVSSSTNGLPEEAYISSVSNTNDLLGDQDLDIPLTFKPNYDNKAICDFIFRLDITNDYNGNSTDDAAAYDVLFDVTNNGTTTTVSTVNISPKYYDEYVNNHNFNSAIWSSLSYGYGNGNGKFMDFINSEQNNIRNFPIWSRANHRPYTSSELTGHNTKYAVVRAVIDLGSNPTISKIVCRLKPHNATSGKGIFIRGLRVRSQIADDLLRSKIDDQLTGTTGEFPTIKKALSGFLFSQNSFSSTYDGSIDIWNKIPGVQACNECTVQGWPAMAYISQLFNKWSKGKSIYPFVTWFNNMPWWRAVYEDLNATTPPQFVPECDAMFYPTDQTDNINGVNIDFETQGYPKDLVPRNIMETPGFTLYGYNVQNYDVFTKRNQMALDMCLGEGSMLNNEVGFAHPEPGRKLADWTGNVIDIGKFAFQSSGDGAYVGSTKTGDDFGIVDPATGIPASGSVRKTILDKIHSGHYCDWGNFLNFDLSDIMPVKTANAGGNSTTAAWVPKPYWALSLDNTTGGTTTNYSPSGPEASTDNPNYVLATDPNVSPEPVVGHHNRFMTGPEMRYVSWANLAWGSKGVLYNTFYNEDLEELGVLGSGGQTIMIGGSIILVATMTIKVPRLDLEMYSGYG